MKNEEPLPAQYQGSHWIVVNHSGMAACPHCQKLSRNSSDSWCSGCKHVIGPGTEKGQPAIIFKGQP